MTKYIVHARTEDGIHQSFEAEWSTIDDLADQVADDLDDMERYLCGEAITNSRGETHWWAEVVDAGLE